jgi:hypothetical protein
VRGRRLAVCTSCTINGIMGGLETDVDCGGATCIKDCDIGGACLVDSDCVTGKCDTGKSQCRVLTTQQEPCGDGVLNHEETDADCAGPMPLCSSIGKLCPVTKVCAADSDCRSGTCDQAYTTAAAGGNVLCVSCSTARRTATRATSSAAAPSATAVCWTPLTCRGEADCASDQCSSASAGEFCDSMACDYRGTAAAAAGGVACRAWAVQFPHAHTRTAMNYPKVGLEGEHSYCRNPDCDEAAWCYTTDANTRCAYCNVGQLRDERRALRLARWR